LNLMGKGEYQQALDYFERASKLTPDYSSLEINLGIVNGSLNRPDEAQKHFARAISLTPELGFTYYFYARWLHNIGRNDEAILNLNTALSKEAGDFESRYLLMEIYSEREDWGELKRFAEQCLEIAPNDIKSAGYFL